MIAGINRPGRGQLFQVGYTIDAFGCLLGSRERRKQQRRQNANDRNDDEEFDQGEGSPCHRSRRREEAERLHRREGPPPHVGGYGGGIEMYSHPGQTQSAAISASESLRTPP